MLPTVDWEDETITKSQTENYSGEDRGTSTASVSRLTSALAVIGVLGTLTNGPGWILVRRSSKDERERCPHRQSYDP